jgi:hypothetical protein
MRRKKVTKSPISCSAAQLVALRFRQIHLDFHTSELIPDVGAAFDADAFAETLSEARVNWVTLFAKCHHGMSYYPTKVGTPHPSLKFDLLGEQVEACRKRGIVTPAYISVRVDERNAHVHPDWIGQLKDGKLWKWGGVLDAGWNNHCMNNPNYVGQLEAQAVEVLKWYDVEGLFFDMCYNPDPGCFCPRCFDGMKRLGLDFTSDADHRRFEYLVTRDYTRRLAKTVRSVRKNATLIFNGRMRPEIRGELDVFTHVEIEALPTGGWGYSFFPIHARYARTLPRPLQGMTARFHKSWGDFGSIKTKDQLLYESGTILAATAVMNVGDQCHPRGALDKGAYQTIGAAFRHVEKCEPWCIGARPVSEIGVMMLPASSADSNIASPAGPSGMPDGADGAGRMLLELKHQFDIIYPDAALDRYRVVILPDVGWIDPAARKRLAAYIADGGAVIFSHQATLENAAFACPGSPVRYVGPNPSKPCYMDLDSVLGNNLLGGNLVFYDNSAFVKPVTGAIGMGKLVGTYFNRAYDHFCSHSQTPYDKKTAYPVGALKGHVAYLAPAVFKAYRDHAYSVYKRMVANLLDRLLPEPMVKTHAPSAMEISVNRQVKEKRLVTHMVNFQPQRRHIHVEWIEDIYPIHDVALAVRTEKCPTAVYLAPRQESVSFRMNGNYCELTVPEVEAHQMVVFEGV